jgi:hypothetical protein
MVKLLEAAPGSPTARPVVDDAGRLEVDVDIVDHLVPGPAVVGEEEGRPSVAVELHRSAVRGVDVVRGRVLAGVAFADQDAGGRLRVLGPGLPDEGDEPVRCQGRLWFRRVWLQRRWVSDCGLDRGEGDSGGQERRRKPRVVRRSDDGQADDEAYAQNAWAAGRRDPQVFRARLDLMESDIGHLPVLCARGQGWFGCARFCLDGPEATPRGCVGAPSLERVTYLNKRF